MDKSGDFENIAQWLQQDIQRVADALSALAQELYQPLLDEKNEKIQQTTSSETLRNYIKISRTIQETLFAKISTHSLTIERLADHILCRRAAIERDNKKTKTVSEIAKVTSAKPSGLFEAFEKATAGMTLDEKEAFLKKLRGE